MKPLTIEDGLVVAASRLQALAPNEFADFMGGLVAYAALQRDKMLGAVGSEQLLRSQGIATGLKALVDQLDNPVVKAAKIMERR